MRRLTILALGLAFLAGTAWALTLRYSSGTAGISVSDVNTTTTFTDNHSGGGDAAFKAQAGYVYSRPTSANACFFDLDGVATTDDIRVEPGASVPFGWNVNASGPSGGWPSIGSICATGETATFDIVAGR